MMEMEQIFFSGTFGGELLSLAAAKVVLEKHLNEDISGQLNHIGGNLKECLEEIISENNLDNVLQLSGHPSWTFLNWKPTSLYSTDVLKTFFMQEMFEKGVLVLNSHNVSIAMDKRITKTLLHKYELVLKTIKKNIEEETLLQNLRVQPLEPLFKVR